MDETTFEAKYKELVDDIIEEIESAVTQHIEAAICSMMYCIFERKSEDLDSETLNC